jgi:hypothetical protein
MDGFLADGLTRLASLKAEERAALRKRFDGAMVLNRKLFGEHAFRKSLTYEGLAPARSVINISLFEVCAVTMGGLPDNLDKGKEDELRQAVVDLVLDEEFARAITYSTNSTASVQRRFSVMEEAVREAVLS